MAKLTKVEKFLLENQGEKYTSYRCPVHGIVQTPNGEKNDRECAWPQCGLHAEFIADPVAYAKAN